MKSGAERVAEIKAIEKPTAWEKFLQDFFAEGDQNEQVFIEKYDNIKRHIEGE